MAIARAPRCPPARRERVGSELEGPRPQRGHDRGCDPLHDAHGWHQTLVPHLHGCAHVHLQLPTNRHAVRQQWLPNHATWLAPREKSKRPTASAARYRRPHSAHACTTRWIDALIYWFVSSKCVGVSGSYRKPREVQSTSPMPITDPGLLYRPPSAIGTRMTIWQAGHDPMRKSVHGR